MCAAMLTYPPRLEPLEPRRLLTVLTFDALSGDGNPVDQSYGDRAPGTPNVTVSYRADGSEPRVWGTGFGDLTNVLYANDSGDGILRIKLTADEGHVVTLSDFDLAGWTGGAPAIDQYTIRSIEVLDENGNALAEASDVAVGAQNGAIPYHTPLPDRFNGVTSRELQIRIDVSNLADSARDRIGIDNISFWQSDGGSAARSLKGQPLYVLVHGFQWDSSLPPWVSDMAWGIDRRTGLGDTKAQIFGAERTVSGLPQPVSGGATNFLLFNWATDSGVLTAGSADEDAVAGALAGYVADRLPDSGTIDIHFIGHSRGCFVINEAIRRLSALGLSGRIGFLQMTTLDPQPYNTLFDDDGALESNPGGIVDLADNYYQHVHPDADTAISGEAIPGALNVDLTGVISNWTSDTRSGISKDHQKVHDWYQWTIDTTDAGPASGYQDDVLKKQEEQLLMKQYAAGTHALRDLLFGLNLNLDLDLDGHVDIANGGAGLGFHWSQGDALAPPAASRYSGLDLVFVIDTTSSMRDDIDAVKAAAIKMVRQTIGQIPNARVGIVTYRDFGDYEDGKPARTALAMTGSAEAAIDAINALEVDGGGDDDEAVYSGVMHALDMSDGLGGWRGGTVRKSIILFGDAPPHDPEPNTGYTRASVQFRAFNVDPADVFSVVAGSDTDAAASFASLSAGARGQAYLAGETTSTVDAVVSALANAAAGISFATLSAGVLTINGGRATTRWASASVPRSWTSPATGRRCNSPPPP